MRTRSYGRERKAVRIIQVVPKMDDFRFEIKDTERVEGIVRGLRALAREEEAEMEKEMRDVAKNVNDKVA